VNPVPLVWGFCGHGDTGVGGQNLIISGPNFVCSSTPLFYGQAPVALQMASKTPPIVSPPPAATACNIAKTAQGIIPIIAAMPKTMGVVADRRAILVTPKPTTEAGNPSAAISHKVQLLGADNEI